MLNRYHIFTVRGFQFGDKNMNSVDIIVPCYNEAEGLSFFYNECRAVLDKTAGYMFRFIFIDDGSSDDTLRIIRTLAENETDVSYISFSRNFGKEAAMLAGLKHSTADLVVIMDADLQHPPACIPEMIRLFDDGYDVISMVRTENRSAGLIKNITSGGFYAVMNAMSGTSFEKNASDFFAVSRRAAEVLRRDYRERVRFLRGYVQSIGFRRTTLQYAAADRAAGHSKYSIRKLFRFSMNTIMSFSDLPLRLGIYAGALSGIISMILFVYTVWSKVTTGTPDGYATIICVICFMFTVLFLLVGIIGQYIGILFQEVKGRPIYLVEETLNFAAGKNAPAGSADRPDDKDPEGRE